MGGRQKLRARFSPRKDGADYASGINVKEK